MQKVKQRGKRERRKLRIRKKVDGVADRPRLTVFRSNKFVYGQIIDDEKGVTLVGTPLLEVRKIHDKTTKSDAAEKVGELIAELAKKQKIERVVFDRNGYKYHGRVKMFAEGARKGGLEF